MSKLDELIQQLCPDGVEWKTLNDIGEFFGGLTGKSKNDFIDGNAAFITYSNIYSNPSLNLNIDEKVRIDDGEKQNVIQYGDILFTGSSETPEECGMSSVVTKEPTEKMYLNSFCFGLRLFELDKFNFDYLKHLFRSTVIRKEICKTANGVTRFNVSKKKMGEIAIPLPPLPVQEEIVRLLDQLTETTQKYQAELEAELNVRKKQYEEYRNQLLDLEGKEGVEMKMLGEVCDKTTNIKWKNISEEIVFKYIDLSSVNVENNSIESVSDINKTIAPSRAQQLVQTEDVILGTTRPTLKRFCVITESYNGQICSTGYCIYRAKKHIVNFKWIYHNIGCTKFWDYCEAKQQGAGYPCLSNADAMAYKISIPPLTEQERIVNILDRMEKTHKELCQSIETEIRMRKQQYEYYRNQLLDFKKKEE